MNNETDFLNGALGKIGAAPIRNRNDGTSNANWCEVFFDNIRRAWLRSHYWNFAEARTELLPTPDPPSYEYSFQYPLPPDFLRMKEFNGENTGYNPAYGYWVCVGRYKIEGKMLLTNESPVRIVYVKDIAEPQLWDPLFYQFLQLMLAAELANAINKSATRSNELATQGMRLILPVALAVDGQDGPIMPYQSPDLLWGR